MKAKRRSVTTLNNGQRVTKPAAGTPGYRKQTAASSRQRSTDGTAGPGQSTSLKGPAAPTLGLGRQSTYTQRGPPPVIDLRRATMAGTRRLMQALQQPAASARVTQKRTAALKASENIKATSPRPRKLPKLDDLMEEGPSQSVTSTSNLTELPAGSWPDKPHDPSIRNRMAIRKECEKTLKAHCKLLHSKVRLMEAQSARWEEERTALEASQEAHQELQEAHGRVEKALRDERDKVAQLEIQVAQQTAELDAHKTTIGNQKADITGLRSSVEVAKSSLEVAQAKTDSAEARCSGLEDTVAQQQASIEKYIELQHEHEVVRRILHNTVQELKGNIRVFCRVRPLLPKEDGYGEPVGHIKYPDELDSKKIVLFSDLPTSPHDYVFDRVFQPGATQAEVFHEISQLVQSALDGYNVSIFAYGQTGSGKTFTMEGPGIDKITNDPTLAGMIPQAMTQVFKYADEQQSHGWTYTMEASFVEIYNEQLRDLLNWSENQRLQIRRSEKSVLVDGLTYEEVTSHQQIRRSEKSVLVDGLTYEEVTSHQQVFELLRRASKKRAVAGTRCNEHSSRSHSLFCLKIIGENVAGLRATQTRLEETGSRWYEVFELLRRASKKRAVAGTRCNEHSSRSHSLFCLKIIGENVARDEKCEAQLNLIDLAGSERLKQSGAEGERLTETKHINTSLSTLGNVIKAITEQHAHVPYRNSKLTQLLEMCLAGNSKTLMFVNVAPSKDSTHESVNSLRFASKANECVIGTARKKLGSASTS